MAWALHSIASMNVQVWQVMVPGALALALVVLSILAAARRVGLVGPTATGLALWLAATFALARWGFFQRFDVLPPRVMVAATVAIATGVTVMRRAAVRRPIDDTTLAVIAALQVFRVPVEVALHALYVRGAIPVQMTWSGRNVDVFVGLSAPLVAYAFHRARIGRRALALWHVASFAALVNIVATAALSFPGPMRHFREGVSAALVATAPFVWLPTLLVPFAAVSHVVSLRALLRGTEQTASVVVAPPLPRAARG